MPYLEASLAAIGADTAATLAGRAIAALEIDGPITADAVRSAMDADDDARDDELDTVDQAYYAAEIYLAPQLLAFIRDHRDQIRLP